MKKYIISLCLASVCLGIFSSCEKFLDKEPLSQVSPENYFSDVSHLQSYLDGLYTDILPSHTGWNGIFGHDSDTDNQVGKTAHDRYTLDMWKVPMDGGNWNFDMIFKCNYFLQQVHIRYGENLDGSQNQISGDLNTIKHYLGEGYFLRACEYFKRYQEFGDFPIVKEPLSPEMESLRLAAKRSPRNEVARFILDDLDKAYDLLKDKDMPTTRINKEVALLLKSRVALFEGTWLKYFKNTAFVPNGPDWPGVQSEYNSNYQYPEGSIEEEINYFLEQAMESSKILGDEYVNRLVDNTGLLQQSASDPINPYFNMFGDIDLSGYDEVLLWRQYAYGISTHTAAYQATAWNAGIGLTRGYVQSFLMKDGTPIYTHGSYADGDGSYYMGDKTLAAVRQNKDSRLSLFLVEPGQKNILYESAQGVGALLEVIVPKIYETEVNLGASTGYGIRKGGSFYQAYSSPSASYTGAICYRAVEALLNYMEASYERTGDLDATAKNYWKAIRERSKIDSDFEKTIRLTQMDKEAENDWGAYSAGKLIDATLYNIRRERRCELLAEGLRYMDLCRWRAMDQLITTPYHIEGFHLWNTEMEDWYTDEQLISDGSDNATVSSLTVSGEYLRPFEVNSKQNCYEGCTWKLGHYLSPIMIKQIMLAAPDGKTVSESPLYQNPYWPLEADKPATK